MHKVDQDVVVMYTLVKIFFFIKYTLIRKYPIYYPLYSKYPIYYPQSKYK